jgi:hypothetical protein
MMVRRHPNLWAAMAVVLLGAAAIGCGTPSEDLPAEVLGRWVTSEARYADRFMEISRATVRFGTGGAGSETYPISHVTIENEPRGRLIRITYVVEDDEMQLSFHYDPGDSTIRLQNQSSFRWSRVQAS